MEDSGGPGPQTKSMVDSIISNAKGVITNPVEFYRNMPKTGGFGDPLVFAAVIGVLVGIVQAIVGLVMLPGAAKFMGLAAIIWGPIAAVIGSFVGGAIVFVIWKIMGSNENYETAYRCGAYAYAIAPITVLAGLIPYVGSLVGLFWGLYLLVTASVEVHKIAAKTAWTVFGIIAAIFFLMNVGCQMAARKMKSSAAAWQQEMEKAADEMQKSSEELSKEAGKAGVEANKAAAAMMKALEAQSRQARIEMEKAAKEAQAEADKAAKEAEE